MNDQTPIPAAESPLQQEQENRLTSEQFEDFREALDILYIFDNLSGRLQFLKNWPAAAAYLFGEELIGYDHDGAKDIERRRELEEQAEDRRLDLLDIAENLEERSVENSALQLEYVESVVNKLETELSLLFYAPKIVSRFRELPAEPVDEEEEGLEETSEQVEESTQPETGAATAQQDDFDPLDDIEPISLDSAPGGPADAPMKEVEEPLPTPSSVSSPENAAEPVSKVAVQNPNLGVAPQPEPQAQEVQKSEPVPSDPPEQQLPPTQAPQQQSSERTVPPVVEAPRNPITPPAPQGTNPAPDVPEEKPSQSMTFVPSNKEKPDDGSN